MTTLTLPTASEMISGIAAYASPYFTEFLAVIWIPISIAVVGGALMFLTRNGRSLAKRVFGGGRRGGSRRKRFA